MVAHMCDPTTGKAEAGGIVLSSGATEKDTVSRQITLAHKADPYLSLSVLAKFMST